MFFSRCWNPDPAPFEKNNGKLKQLNPNKRKWRLRLAQKTRGVDDIADRTACEYAMNILLKMRESLQREVIKESYSIEGTKYACKEKAFWKKRNGKQSIRAGTSNGKQAWKTHRSWRHRWTFKASNCPKKTILWVKNFPCLTLLKLM